MTPIFVAHIEARLTLFQRGPATPETYFNWIPACGENDGLGGQW
ncbi:hypothetical protein [Candidatus Spongiihabitans sp.]